MSWISSTSKESVNNNRVDVYSSLNTTQHIPSSNDSLTDSIFEGPSSVVESSRNYTILNGTINDKTTLLNNNSNLHRMLFEMPKMDNVVDILSILCSLAVIFGGLVPYIPQYLKIKRSRNSDGFSTYVCLTLLIANILRILFWFGHNFELPLLIQSFVMIAGMIAMMEICIRVRERRGPPYMISTIGFRSNHRSRVMGKLDEPHDAEHSNSVNGDKDDDDGDDDDDEFISESMPIYSVVPCPSSAPIPRTSINSDTSDQHEVDLTVDNQQQYQAASSCSTVSYQHSQPDATITPISLDNHSFTSAYQINDSHISTYSSSSQQNHADGSLKSSNSSTNNGRLLNKSLIERDFWDWDDYLSYVKFLSLFTFVVALLTYLLLDNHSYIETLGFVAVLTESMLGVPQLLRNYRKKSTRGMSVEMIVMWLSGDLFKTLYFIIRQAPVQFYICGSIQVLVDLLILGQVMLYRRPNVTYRKLPKST